jgi:hypothetical protein
LPRSKGMNRRKGRNGSTNKNTKTPVLPSSC